MRKLIDKQLKNIIDARHKNLITQYEYRMYFLKLCEEYGDKIVAKRANALGIS